METEYIKRNVGSCLAAALAEVATVRPPDPVEYLAIWLLKYKANLNERDEMISKEETEPQSIPVEDQPDHDLASDLETQKEAENDIPVASVQRPTFSNLTESRPGSKLSRIEEEVEKEVNETS